MKTGLVLGVFLLGTFSILGLEPAGLVYRQHAAEIPKEGLKEIDGWIFSAASDHYRGSSVNAGLVAEEAAKAAAEGRYLDLALDIRDGKPAVIGMELENQCRARASSAVISSLKVSGLTDLEQQSGDGTAHAVVALPSGVIKPKPLPWSEALELIRSHAESIDDLALLCEIQGVTGDSKKACAEFQEGVLKKYPLLTVRCPSPIPEGWTSLPGCLEQKKLDTLSDDQLIELLAKRPWDPMVTGMLTERFREKKWTLAADTVAGWPVVSWKDDKAADGLMKALGETSVGQATPQRLGILRVLCHLGDQWVPFPEANADASAKQSFDEGHVEEAFWRFVDVLGSNPSADNANYAAACLIAMKNPALAAIIARVACQWVPSHPYAKANLMLACSGMGNREEAGRLAKSIMDDPASSGWAKGKAALVLGVPAK